VLYRLPDMTPAGRFRIGKDVFGATEETDGIELAGGDFGPDYPAGLFVAQDGDNRPHAQNFKLVSWRAILQATGNR
jgi:3-phytase